jgi:hypothetical protein
MTFSRRSDNVSLKKRCVCWRAAEQIIQQGNQNRASQPAQLRDDAERMAAQSVHTWISNAIAVPVN